MQEPYPGEPSPTVPQLVASFLADQKSELAPSTYQDRQRVLAAFADAFPGPPAAIKPSQVKAWILANPGWRAPTTRWGALNVVKRLFNWAVADGWIAKNPLKSLKLTPGEPRRPTTLAEYQAMLRGSSALFRRALVFLRVEGCRPGEMAALCWEWLDWGRGTAVYPKDRHKTGKRTGKPKELVLTRVALALLQWLRRNGAEAPEGCVFVNSKGRPWTRVALAMRLREIRRKTGLPEGATFHGLRHLAASQALARGGNLKLVSMGLGHASTKITEKFYLHFQEQEAIEAIRKAMELGSQR